MRTTARTVERDDREVCELVAEDLLSQRLRLSDEQRMHADASPPQIAARQGATQLLADHDLDVLLERWAAPSAGPARDDAGIHRQELGPAQGSMLQQIGSLFCELGPVRRREADFEATDAIAGRKRLTAGT